MSTALQKHRFLSDDGGNHLPCVLSLPDGYDDAAARWPLLLFLHGASERGEDNPEVHAWLPARSRAGTASTDDDGIDRSNPLGVSATAGLDVLVTSPGSSPP